MLAQMHHMALAGLRVPTELRHYLALNVCGTWLVAVVLLPTGRRTAGTPGSP